MAKVTAEASHRFFGIAFPPAFLPLLTRSHPQIHVINSPSLPLLSSHFSPLYLVEKLHINWYNHLISFSLLVQTENIIRVEVCLVQLPLLGT